MPRRSRDEGRNAVHHVFAHAVANEPLFVDDEDRRKYLELLGRVVRIHGWRCQGYCLMGNHIHLLVETAEPNLGLGMQRLHGEYAAYFNRRHAGRGHRFNGRFGNRRIRTDRQFYAVVRYIARNPTDAGLCELPEEWPWSSHWHVLDGSGPDWFDHQGLMSYFGAGGGAPLDRYGASIAL